MFNRIAPLINVLHGDGLAPGGSCIGPGDVFFTQPLRLSTWTANSCSTFLLWKRNGTPHQSQRKGAADQMLCFLKAWRRIWNFFRNLILHGIQSKVISGTLSEWSSMCQTFLWGFLTPPVEGADLRAALVASCFLGAFPPVDLRAVCLVRAIAIVQMILMASNVSPLLLFSDFPSQCSGGWGETDSGR